jgi:hypothetical protein
MLNDTVVAADISPETSGVIVLLLARFDNRILSQVSQTFADLVKLNAATNRDLL